MSKRWQQFALLAIVTAIAVTIGASLAAPAPLLGPLDAVHDRRSFSDGQELRIPATVTGQVQVTDDVTTFAIEGEGVVIDVELEGDPPNRLADGVAVIVRGTWREDVFVASRVSLTGS